MNTVLIIDSCTDLPKSYVEAHQLPVVNLTYHFKGIDYPDDFGQSMDYKSFYDAVRKGEMPTTSQVNADVYQNLFRSYVLDGKAIVLLSFSSALSGSYSSAVLARDMVLEEFPEADISLIDTKCASMGEGLLVYYAVEKLESGASKEELVQWVEENKLKVNHWFTVEDLNHLKRGGRVSGAAAFIGTLLEIKPVLRVDDEGRLVPALKAKGRKKSIKTLFEKFEAGVVKPEEQVIFISHGDCQEDAQVLADMIRAKYQVLDIWINCVGPVIGAHSGPGTIALFFMGDKRIG